MNLTTPIEEVECLAAGVECESINRSVQQVQVNKYGAFHSVALIGNKLALIDDLGEWMTT